MNVLLGPPGGFLRNAAEKTGEAGQREGQLTKGGRKNRGGKVKRSKVENGSAFIVLSKKKRFMSRGVGFEIGLGSPAGPRMIGCS